MMNLSKIFLSAILLFSTIPAFSQNKEEYLFLYEQAAALEKSGSLKEAGTEYKRYLFMQDYAETPGNYIDASYFALSRIYEKNNNIDLALDYFQRGLTISQEAEAISDEELFNLQCKHIALLSKKAEEKNIDISSDYQFAKYILLDDFSDGTKQKAYCAHLQNLIKTNQWEVLQLIFDTYCEAQPDLFTQEQKDLFHQQLSKITGFRPKSPMLAAHLSFIPGLGQLYAQNYKDALNAFLLNGSLISLCVYSCYTLNLWDFSLFELNPTIRFYRGNLVNAQKETYEYNNAKIKEYASPLITIISEVEGKIHFENCN